jgi:hypothetical protein
MYIHKMKVQLVLLICVLSRCVTLAQPVPLEVMVGHQNYYQQIAMSKVDARSKMGYSSASSVLLVYSGMQPSEIMNQNYLTYSITPSLKLGIGTFYASAPGLKPSLNLQFAKRTKNFLFAMNPRIDLKQKPTFDVMTFLEGRPHITESLKIYFRLQLMFNYNVVQHNRSYQYFRVGIIHRNMQIGVAANIDAYGKNYSRYSNYGIFFKINLNEKS